ncbi:MAG: peptidylprolyl isomerase, partial [Dolichospermum sp.]
ANPPQILKPVITPKGAHIIIVEEIIEPELNEQMRVQIFDDLFTNWLKDQVNKLEIVATLGQSPNFSSSPAEILSKAS